MGSSSHSQPHHRAGLSAPRLWLLKTSRAQQTALALEAYFSDILRDLAISLEGAAHGEAGAARRYIGTWKLLAHRVVKIIRTSEPDLLERAGVGTAIEELLLPQATLAPFSTWVAHLGLERGLGVALVAELRTCLPGAAVFRPLGGRWQRWAEPAAMRRALRQVERALAEGLAAQEPSPLARVRELFELDRTELGSLFGVSRQAVEQWEERGVPAERQAKLTTILSVGELLNRKLRPGVLPGVARTKAEAYGERTMLDMMASDEHDALLKDVRASFDWAATA